jgi:hypothetical protein
MYSKIIHFHMPKTGGTSLNNWLDTLVPACKARPANRGDVFLSSLEVADALVSDILADKEHFHPAMRSDFDWDVAHTPQEHARHFIAHSEYGRDARAFWNVLHDHSPAFVDADNSAYRFVVLREPASRFVSFIRDWRRLSEEDLALLPSEAQVIRRSAMACNADTFIRRHADSRIMRGMTQTSILMKAALYGLPVDYLANCDPAPLVLATKALDSLFDLVGVVDRIDDVVRCIARDVGACPVESLGHYNKGAVDPKRDLLSAESLAILQDVCADDFNLYAKAQGMLESKLSPSYEQSDFELQHLDWRLQQLAPRFESGRRVFSLNDQIIGCGVHGRDAGDTEGVTVWTGPSPRTVLYVPVPPRERLDLYVDVGGYIHPSVGESLRIRVDGLDHSFRRTAARDVLERIVVPVHTKQPFCKVELIVDRTYTPAEAGHGGGDSRRLGIALKGYGYCLTPTEGVVFRQPSDAAPQPSGGKVLSEASHSDCLWIEDMTSRMLRCLATEADPERLIDLMAWDVPASELNATPTAAHVEHAFQRFHLRAAPKQWLDYWVGRPDLTVRHLYRDLVNGDEFKHRRERIGRAEI